MVRTNYEQARIAIDAVVLRYKEKKLQVFLNRREREPYDGRFELPGGLLAPGESAEETLRRKVDGNVTGFSSAFVSQFFTFTAPERDPRARTVTIAYLALLPPPFSLNTSHWVDLNEGKLTFSISDFAFDHHSIVGAALNHLRSQQISILQHLLPESFRLNELHQLAEVAFAKKFDNRNFRRMIVSPGLVQETGEKSKGGAHRPAKLYSFAQAN